MARVANYTSASAFNHNLQFATEAHDDGDIYASNLFTAPANGVYELNTAVILFPSGAWSPRLAFRVNGTCGAAGGCYDIDHQNFGAVEQIGMSGTMTIKLDMGDTVQLRLTSGNARSVQVSEGHFSGHRLY